MGFPDIARIGLAYGRVSLRDILAVIRGDSAGREMRRQTPDTGLTPFAVGIDAQRENVEIVSGRNGSRLVVPVGDWELLTAVLRDFDPRSSQPEKPCLDLFE